MATDMFLDCDSLAGKHSHAQMAKTPKMVHHPMWGEPCGNGWYDANFQEQCEPRVNGIEVKGCADDCKVKTNWKCDDPSISLRYGGRLQ
jgi:hypothetical protein